MDSVILAAIITSISAVIAAIIVGVMTFLSKKLGEDNDAKGKNSFEQRDFYGKNISKLMHEYMGKTFGITVKTIRNGWDITLDVLIDDLARDTEKNRNDLRKIAESALGYAFDEKYYTKDYAKDVRGHCDEWIYSFNYITNKILKKDIKKLKTLVVGIGNGIEGRYLYTGISDLIIVDIAPKSLKQAKKILKTKNAYVMNAQKLDGINDSSIAAYVSLATYQSSYFDVDKSIAEANRVLENNGIIIISVTCGYIESNRYIDGLFDQRTNEYDRNRPYELCVIIIKKLITLNFTNIGIRSTRSEIFVYGEKTPRHDNSEA